MAPSKGETVVISPGIYGIHNTLRQKWYIGQSRNPLHREVVHFRELRGGYHFNKELQSDFTAQKGSQFVFVLLCSCDVNALGTAEREWIRYYKSNHQEYGYNHTFGGNGPLSWIPKPLSRETKTKISQANTGRKHSPEAIQRMVEGHRRTGFRPSPDQRAKISRSLTGRIISAEHASNIANSLRGKVRTLASKIRQSLSQRVSNPSSNTLAKRRSRLKRASQFLQLELPLKLL